ncbi:MAG: molybdate ABC transporter substrate-binding protein [Desulfobacterales bacterium]
MKERLFSRCVVLMMGLTILFSAIALSAQAAEKRVVTVFAAASTTDAVTEICELFMKKKLGIATFSFGSSSTLAKQIENLAPADIFISANIEWMDYLDKKQLIDSSSRIDLLGNKIVLIAPADSTIQQVDVAENVDLSGLLGDSRLAMGDPNHVPAGIYAKQALEKLQIWKSVENAIAPSKDVREVLVLVERGEAPLGVVYSTDASITNKVKIVGEFPIDSHPSIVYPVAIVSGRKIPEVESLFQFFKGPEAKAIFEKHGFLVR